MKLTLKSRMIFWIWGFTAILFSLILYLNFVYNSNQEIKELRENSEVSATAFAAVFDELLSRLSTIPEMNAIAVRSNFQQDREEIKKQLKSVLESSKKIFGVCIAFAPKYINNDKKLFAPYYFRSGENIVYKDLAKVNYNYTEKDWYKIPREKHEPMWSEPYFDHGGGDILMSTYSVPIYQDGIFIGVATMDISLDNMTDAIKNIRLNKTGYIFIVSKTGKFISFPDKKQIMEGNVLTFNKTLGERMLSGKAGFMKTYDPLHQEESWISYHPIQTSGYSIGLVYPEREVLANVFTLQNVTMIFGSAGLIVLLFLVMFISRSITRPLSELVEDAKQVAEGNLEKGISVETRSIEVETLKVSLNRMIESLKENIDNLNMANQAKERLLVSSIRALANSIEARDSYTRGHSERVTKYSVRIAEKMEMEKAEIEKLRYAAVLHDIGKIKIKEELLNKPGKLTNEEYEILKKHPEDGAKILKPVEEFQNILPYLYHHHERYDGKGYPRELTGEDIPLASRIMSVADTFDAMTSNRPYRKALPLKKAISELKRNAGTQFDPQVVEVFLEIITNEREWLFNIMEEDWSTMELDE